MSRGLILSLFVAVSMVCSAWAEYPSHEQNVVYGEKDGMGLLMDVFQPSEENRVNRGVIFAVSGGFVSLRPMLDSMEPIFERVARETGYTVFAVLHGTQPRYTVKEILPDYQRAVRFIRHYASRFGIDPQRLGIIGFSSGGHISLMTGVRGDDGHTGAQDEVDHEPSRVGAVVSYFPPTDFLNYGSEGVVDLGTGVLKPFRRAFFHYDEPEEGEEAIGRDISPRYHASSDDPPVLLLHGDKDELVPLQQSQLMVEALQAAGGTVELVVKEGAGHGWANIFDDLSAAFAWFDRHLEVDRPQAE